MNYNGYAGGEYYKYIVKLSKLFKNYGFVIIY